MSEQSNARRAGAAVGRAASSAARGTRSAIRKNPTADKVYRTGVGVVGGSTLALGVVLMPLPGPGTLIVLGGLGILATEFEGARRVSGRANAAAQKVARKASEAARAARARRDAARTAAPTPAPPAAPTPR
ncbi:PGPGW domain-containing protein [Microterricola pindariensis]|uniref:TIGR02611 family protein n=1 Tax=Microterricola pindariensis TaxID=478010 RepID=A0ABX5AZ28_9MICO|nr:PGPGW domain-containing protein [Microterricola pindariensis]PPL20152.1 hypothetical protein GY24_02210 [Microterricola pindariensis]